jgi:hypothetical protein
MSSVSLTSPARNSALPFSRSISARVSLPLPSVVEVPTTEAPSRANNTAMARPRPEPKPVTRATFPSSFMIAPQDIFSVQFFYHSTRDGAIASLLSPTPVLTT